MVGLHTPIKLLYLIRDVVPVEAEGLHLVILRHDEYGNVIACSAEEEKDHTSPWHGCPAKAGPLQNKRTKIQSRTAPRSAQLF